MGSLESQRSLAMSHDMHSQGGECHQRLRLKLRQGCGVSVAPSASQRKRLRAVVDGGLHCPFLAHYLSLNPEQDVKQSDLCSILS